MISEKELAELSYTGAPNMQTPVPGPESLKVLQDVPKYECLTRPGGANPPVFDGRVSRTVIALVGAALIGPYILFKAPMKSGESVMEPFGVSGRDGRFGE